MQENREQWSSKTSFILAAAGSAVGLGNIWKFPYCRRKWGCSFSIYLFDMYHTYRSADIKY